MNDLKNLGINDIDRWAEQAPPDQVVTAAHKLLDRVSDFSETHRQGFQSKMQSSTRQRLFQNEPVG